ncbi:MAG: hypothetical protein L0212_04000 [Acidobacteria bacterium]|nr:hypothetical protein [Acidobacteriota bacterium]
MRKRTVVLLLLGLILLPLLLWAQAPPEPPAPDPATLAGKVAIIAGMVFAVLQGLKKLLPAISGTAAVVLNVVLAGVGTLVAAPAGSLGSMSGILTLAVQAILAALAAAGAHDALRRPTT